MATKNDVVKTLIAMGELSGRQMSETAVDIFLMDLEDYNPDEILHALTGCRKELQRFPNVNDVVSRIQALDGRPGVEEAWAMIPKNEDDSAFVTEEMRYAFGASYSLEGDQVSARMAFKEAYAKVVAIARKEKKKALWTPMFGRNISGRAAAISKAMNLNLISTTHAFAYAKGLEHLLPQKDRVMIESQSEQKLIGDKVTAEEVKQLIGGTFK